MEFINETTWDSLAFEAMDQHGELFDVVCVKAGFSTQAGGLLVELPEPVPLATEDETLGKRNEASPRWESDQAPFKPKCDVPVNATAWVPNGASRHFEARLRRTAPHRETPVMPTQQGLNPFMNPSDIELAKWEHECAHLKAVQIPDTVISDKTLALRGPRALKKKFPPVRAFWGLLRLVSLGLIRRNPWKRTRSAKVECLPLRDEAAWGWDNKVLSMEKTAKRVKRKDWLLGANPSQVRQAALSGEPDQTIARASHPCNNLGVGLAALWCLKASRLKRPPAPQGQQIPYLQGGETLELFNLCAPDHPAATQTGGSTLLRLRLPEDRPCLVMKDARGRFGTQPLVLDTLLVEPEEGRVLLTYRAVIPQDAGMQWAILKVQKSGEPDQLASMQTWMKAGVA